MRVNIKAALAATAGLCLLAGCGGGSDGTAAPTGDRASGGASLTADTSAEDVASSAKADMLALDSVHLTGDFTSDGSAIKLDLALTTDGDCTGTIGVGDGTAELVASQGTSWFKPDNAFWEAQAGDSASQIESLVGDKWVLIPAGQESFTSFCDLDSLLSDLNSNKDDQKLVNDGVEDYEGTSAVKLTGTDSTDGGTITIYVAAEGPHYILHLEKSGGADDGEATFAEFNDEVSVETPAQDDVVDLSSLG